MKKSDLIKVIREVIKEEFAKVPKFGDIHPTDEKTGERPGMKNRPKDGMDISQQKEMMWAENKELPSSVTMPFQIVEFPNEDVLLDCTVFEPDENIKKEFIEIGLNDPLLYATQKDLHLNKEDLIKHASVEKKRLPIVVGFPNGVKLIQDGHHRLAIQKIMGNESAKVELLSFQSIEEVCEDTEEFINNLGPSLHETCALAGGAVVATSDGSGFASKSHQKEKHEQMWSEEKIGKSGPNGITLFQMGSSLPDELYNQKDGKPSRDPGLTGNKNK